MRVVELGRLYSIATQMAKEMTQLPIVFLLDEMK
jgi:hypothetical protein